MNIIVQFLGPIAQEEQTFDVNDLSELKLKLSQIENLQDWLPNLAVAVNDIIIKDLDFKFTEGDKVSLLPPVCGG
jgi:molybdopterin synthase sulfur carrier subunit